MTNKSGGFLGEVGDFLNQAAEVVGSVAQEIVNEQRQMAQQNAPKPRKPFDPVAYGLALNKKDENAESNQPLFRADSSSSAGSESDGRSSSGKSSGSGSGSSGSNESTVTRETIASGVIALNTLTYQERKTYGPLDFPLIPSESKGSKSEQDKKAPTQSPGCATGIKKAFSSCYSCLSNGLSSLIKKLTPDMSKGADLSSEKVHEAAPIGLKKQRRREPKEKKVGFFESFRSAFRKDREVDLSRFEYNKKTNTYKWVHVSTHKLGSASKFVDKVGGMPSKALEMGVSGAKLGVQGARALGSAGASIGRTTWGAAKFMATPGVSSGTTWTERFESVGRLTEGMGSSNSGYGIGTAALGAGAFAYSAVLETPKAVMPGTRAVKFAGSVAGSIAGGGSSMVSRFSQVGMSVIAPTALR